MNLINNRDGTLSLRLTETQLLVMFSCMREMFAALDKRSFDARIGASADDVAGISEQLLALMEAEGIEQ